MNQDSDVESVASSTSIDEPMNIDEDIDNEQEEINNEWLNEIRRRIGADISAFSLSEIIDMLHKKGATNRYEFNELRFYSHHEHESQIYACDKTNEILNSIQPIDLLPYNLSYIYGFGSPCHFLGTSSEYCFMIEIHAQMLYESIRRVVAETGQPPTLTDIQFTCIIDKIKYHKMCLYNHINCLNTYIQQLLNL